MPDRPERILLVEDSHTQARMMLRLLQHAGFEPTHVVSAEAALAVIGPDTALVLTDLHLPGASGFDLCRSIRARADWRAVRVVVQTSADDPTLVLRGLEADADGFLTKGARLDVLVGTLRRTLARTRSPEPKAPVEVTFLGGTYRMCAGRDVLLDVLATSFEGLVGMSQRVRESEEALQRMLAVVPVGIVAITAVGTPVLVNDVARAFVRDRSFPRLAEWVAILEPHARDGRPIGVAELPTALTLADGIPRNEVELWLSIDGERQPYLVSTQPVLGPDGAVAEVITTFTSLHAVEAERARTRDAEARAVAASRSKSAFLANMSHELRTPLNAIIGYAEMLEEDLEDAALPHAVADLRRVRDAGHHLLSLVNDILDLSKIEAGRMTLVPEEIVLVDFLEGLRGQVVPLCEKNHNQLDFVVAQDLGVMNVDPIRLRQCLLNLLSNAAKFTSDGNVGLTARRLTRESPGVAFVVHDTGVGMSPSQLDRLFQDFVQGDESTTRRFGGTGLGLALTRRFATMMNGEVSVASAPNVGSTFTLWLPEGRHTRAVSDLEPDHVAIPRTGR